MVLLRGWTVLGLAKGLGRGGARVIQELSHVIIDGNLPPSGRGGKERGGVS